jgi:type VI secretion system secreted protein VgrG
MTDTAAATAFATLTTPLGDEALRFRRMSATERMSRPFEFSVVALSERDDLAPGDLLGYGACVTVESNDGGQRHFHGVVCSFGLEGTARRLFEYRLVLRPWLWLLTQRSDTRIFQKKTVEQILKAVFEPFSTDVKFELKGKHEALEYCVQYRETDFDFVSRLMEREGISYSFRHESGKHTMAITDAATGHPASPFAAEIEFRESLDAAVDLEGISQWRVRHEVVPGKVTLNDYDFEKPKTPLLADATNQIPGTAAKLEVYDPPGGHVEKAAGDHQAGLRLESLQAPAVRVAGAGNSRGIAAGHTFTLKSHPSAGQNVKHLVLSTQIDVEYAGYESGAGRNDYRCAFTAMPATHPLRPERLTRKPTVAGPQTAVVVGPKGEELHVDKHGRVKVQFHWDRHGKSDENSSCWVRVAHPWAGKGWGMVALPRIGQEVVVDFLEGDPDRPLITGRVYNADQAPPYKLPDLATVSTWKSRSSKGGGETDCNELRFDDKKGSEHVWFQAQKDYYRHVRNDVHSLVGNDWTAIVKRDRVQHVQRDDKRIVDRDAMDHVKRKSQLTVDADRAVKIGGKHGTKVATDWIVDAGAGISMKAGANGDVKVGANLGIDAGANVHVKAGATLVIEAGAMITLKAGASSIVIGPNVAITGPMVMINSGGGPGSGGGASPKAPDAPDAVQAPQAKKDPLEGK